MKMLKKLSFRLALIIIVIVVVVLILFAIYLARDQTQAMQKLLVHKGITCAKTGATVMGKMFDTIIDNGFFTLDEVFDLTLVPIELPERITHGYQAINREQLVAVQKFNYATGLDSYLDSAILEIQDQFLEDPEVIYAAMLDKNGYLPTHNSKYSKKLTGDFSYDLKNNRTKRVYRDPAALNAIRNMDQSYYAQTYHRDTGEVMWDFSSPVYVKGRHWGIFRIGFSMENTQKAISGLKWKVILALGSLLIILVFAVGQSSSLMMRPLQELSQGVKRVAKGDLTFQQKITSNDEVGDLARAFNKMVTDLDGYIKKLTETTSEKEKIESELRIAHDIQMGILPKIFPPFPDRKEIDIHAMIAPAKEVGGDFYDFFFIDEHHLCLTIGDVSGKGVPASLLMAVTTTLIRAKAKAGMLPHEILCEVNADLCADNPSNMFVTVFLGILDVKTGGFTYSNGGHNIPYLLLREGTIKDLENTATFILGIESNFKFQTRKMDLNPKDGIYFYTDGVSEAMDKNKKLFSTERLEDVLRTCAENSSQEINLRIYDELKEHMSDEVQSDDITMISLKYLGT